MDSFQDQIRRFAERAKATTTVADPPDLCAGCHNSGWEPSTADPTRLRHCETCDYWDRRRGNVPGMPDAELPSRLANFDDPDGRYADALQQAQYFIDGIHPGLYLHGGPFPGNDAGTGTGKTRLACSVLNELWGRKVYVRFFRVQDLLNQLLPHDDAEDDTTKVMRLASTAAVAVFDDIGNNQASDFARRQLLTIYEARMDHSLRTIWTSNLSLDQLKDFFGDDRLPSRIAGNCKVVRMIGPDVRLRIGPARKRRAQADDPPKERRLIDD